MKYILLLALSIVFVPGCMHPADAFENAGPQRSGTMPPGPGRTVNVKVQDYRFTPDQIYAKPGEKLHIVLTNVGDKTMHEHNMTFDLPNAVVQAASDVDPGEQQAYDVLVPQLPGKYYFHCPVANHYSRGMLGTLIVQ